MRARGLQRVGPVPAPGGAVVVGSSWRTDSWRGQNHEEGVGGMILSRDDSVWETRPGEAGSCVAVQGAETRSRWWLLVAARLSKVAGGFNPRKGSLIILVAERRASLRPPSPSRAPSGRTSLRDGAIKGEAKPGPEGPGNHPASLRDVWSRPGRWAGLQRRFREREVFQNTDTYSDHEPEQWKEEDWE